LLVFRGSLVDVMAMISMVECAVHHTDAKVVAWQAWCAFLEVTLVVWWS
jgi:hypothetical protein